MPEYGRIAYIEHKVTLTCFIQSLAPQAQGICRYMDAYSSYLSLAMAMAMKTMWHRPFWQGMGQLTVNPLSSHVGLCRHIDIHPHTLYVVASLRNLHRMANRATVETGIACAECRAGWMHI
jgi:hypothetical protein